MPSDCCVGCAASSRNRRRCASDSKRRLRTTTRRRRAGVSRSSSSARRSAGTSRRYSTRGSGNAPELDPVRRAACEQLLAVDLVRPAKEVRRRLIGRRPEHGEPERNVRRPPLVLRPLEIGEPLLERRTFCVTLAHRCHTLGGGPVAQLVEQGTFNPKVAGSSPARPTSKKLQTWSRLLSRLRVAGECPNRVPKMGRSHSHSNEPRRWRFTLALRSPLGRRRDLALLTRRV